MHALIFVRPGVKVKLGVNLVGTRKLSFNLLYNYQRCVLAAGH